MRIVNPHVSTDSGLDGTLTIMLRCGSMMEGAPEIQVVLDPIATIDLLRRITAAGLYAVERALAQVAAGPCERCSNTGMIDTRKHGQSWNEHCPDCGPRRLDAAVRAAIAASAQPILATRDALE